MHLCNWFKHWTFLLPQMHATPEMLAVCFTRCSNWAASGCIHIFCSYFEGVFHECTVVGFVGNNILPLILTDKNSDRLLRHVHTCVVYYAVKTVRPASGLVDRVWSKFCTLNFLTYNFGCIFQWNIKIFINPIKKCIILADHMPSACIRSECVGVSIIIYFYVFNLTTCGSVYRPLTNSILQLYSLHPCIWKRLNGTTYLNPDVLLCDKSNIQGSSEE